jgi:hypothetical protein
VTRLRELLAARGITLPANPAHLPRGPDGAPRSNPNRERFAAQLWLKTLFEPSLTTSREAGELKARLENDAGFYISSECLADAALELGWRVAPPRDGEINRVRVYCRRKRGSQPAAPPEAR